MPGLHPSHKNVRFSFDASSFDEICDDCGATDEVPGGWGALAEPCDHSRVKPAPASALAYMVSYQLKTGDCGNKCGTLDEVRAFTAVNAVYWASHTYYSYTPSPPGISVLFPLPVTREEESQCHDSSTGG